MFPDSDCTVAYFIFIGLLACALRPAIRPTPAAPSRSASLLSPRNLPMTNLQGLQGRRATGQT